MAYERSIQGLPVAVELLTQITALTRSGALTWWIRGENDAEHSRWGFAYVTHRSALALKVRVLPDGHVEVITDSHLLTFSSRLLTGFLSQKLGDPARDAINILDGRHHDERIAALAKQLRARFPVPEKWERSGLRHQRADGEFNGVFKANLWIANDEGAEATTFDIEPSATLRIRNLRVIADQEAKRQGLGSVPDWAQGDVVVSDPEIGDLYDDIAGRGACLRYWDNERTGGTCHNDEQIETITQWLTEKDFTYG